MPRELRYIIFAKEEALVALLNFARHRRKPIALGYARRLQIEGGPPVACTLVMHVGAEAGGRPAGEVVAQYRFDEIEIAAALVLACIDSGIPVPATRLRKSVRVLDDDLVLVMCKGVAAGTLDDVGFGLNETRRIDAAPELPTEQASCA